MKQPHENAEFDSFAPGYDAGMDDPLKKMAGASADVFVDLKAAWVYRFLQGEYAQEQFPLALLDFGCGTGGFLRAMQRTGLRANFEGCDISAKMLEEAGHTWNPALPKPPLHHTPAGKLPFATASFDVVTACCVFHHIPPGERLETVRELFRILKPGGRLIILEHNPWNPLTRWIVARCPIDEHAVLLSAPECISTMEAAGFKADRKAFLLFFPPRFRQLWKYEPWMEGLPLGGQYIAVGRAS